MKKRGENRKDYLSEKGGKELSLYAQLKQGQESSIIGKGGDPTILRSRILSVLEYNSIRSSGRVASYFRGTTVLKLRGRCVLDGGPINCRGDRRKGSRSKAPLCRACN